MSNTTAFFEAVRAGETSSVAKLLELEPALMQARDERGQSPILAACYSGRKETRDLLIEKGAHLEIHEAAAAGHLVRAKELVEKHPSLAKGYSPDGFPVLALSAVFGHFEVAKFLHAKGADVNAAATNGTGYTALTGAVTSGHAEIVKWLLENGADPNYRYGPGYSPLLAAAANGHLEIVKMLLANGADLHAKTNDGKNALAIAEERKHAAVAEYIRAKGFS